jgi:bifunctional UDP-N-acetylglucosamine pyrophosphorylase/glucosamine-1-phosphate N-acetyltransferase
MTITPSQAVILAAGENSRFTPFNSRNYHKCNFILAEKPVIVRTVESLVKSGIKEIIVVKSPHDDRIESSLQGWADKNTKLIFRVQDKPLGMANALLEVKDLLNDSFIVTNPQQVNIDQHLGNLAKVISPDKNAVYILSQKTDQPGRYGMLGLNGNRITRVVERPEDLTGLSDQRILGIYYLNREFIDFLGRVKAGQYQLEDALDKYAGIEEVIAVPSDFPGLSLKYAWDLFTLADYYLSGIPDIADIHPGAVVHPTALITGPVIIESGAHIYEYALIQGPCYIGKNSVVGSFCKVRKGSLLESSVELQNSVDVRHSLIGSGTHIHSGFIGDSVIGENTKIGAGFITANRRLDRKNIRVMIGDKLIDTNTSHFGAIIGDNVHIGIHCGTNPGSLIAGNSSVLPMTMVSHS